MKKMIKNKGFVTIPIEDIKNILGITGKYNKIYMFFERVIKPSIKEINDVTDILVEYIPIKVGSKYKDIRFYINYKKEEKKYLLKDSKTINLATGEYELEEPLEKLVSKNNVKPLVEISSELKNNIISNIGIEEHSLQKLANDYGIEKIENSYNLHYGREYPKSRKN